jgi:hypothetical protein
MPLIFILCENLFQTIRGYVFHALTMLLAGIEPATQRLKVSRSATELQEQFLQAFSEI